MLQTGSTFHFFNAATFRLLRKIEVPDVPLHMKSLWSVLWGGKVLAFIGQANDVRFVDTETSQLLSSFLPEASHEEAFAIAGNEETFGKGLFVARTFD